MTVGKPPQWTDKLVALLSGRESELDGCTPKEILAATGADEDSRFRQFRHRLVMEFGAALKRAGWRSKRVTQNGKGKNIWNAPQVVARGK